MKQILLLTLTLSVILLCGCKSKVQKAKDDAASQADSTVIASSWLLTDTVLPQSVNLNQDISLYSLQELRLLRSYPFAIHGYHFMEADINAFFSANTEWYTSLVWKLYEDDSFFPEKYEEVKLTPEEKAFVERIDERIAKLRENQYYQRDSYMLGNPGNIVNLFQFRDVDPIMLDKLKRNNFVITKGENLQLFHAYEENDYRQVPNFITTDLYLQAFHMYFSYILKSLEKEKFIPTLENICAGLYKAAMIKANETDDPELKDKAEYMATFYAIPYHLLTKTNPSIPAKFQKAYEKEIQHINNQEDNFSDFLAFKDAYFPYSLFKPRGHYTREPLMRAYFQAMMWLQTACMCREEQGQLEQAIFQAVLLNTTPNTDGTLLRELYRQVYEPITYLTGEADNLSVMDIALILQKEKVNTVAAALNPTQVASVNRSLMELAKTKNRIKPKIEISCRDKINFMPQRYLADNEILQEMVDVQPNSKRAYPKGLDVFAAFGTTTAETLLTGFYKEPENWNKFSSELKKLKDIFAAKKPVELSVYNQWIGNLTTLQQTDKSQPAFMQTPEWGYKNLNTALASWAELKHDAILYGEQPMAAECGGAGPPDPIVVGYVEPNLPFWKKMSETLKTTQNLLLQNNCLSDDLKGKTEQLSDYVRFLTLITEKELRGEKLTVPEYRSIEFMGSSIEYFTLSVLDPDLHLDNWSLVQGPDKSIAVVADIYTRNVQGCEKNGILHVATGNANNIYVVVEIEGNLYLTRGATFSYYEFVQPLGTRLTDEEWQKMLDEKKAPPTPEWMKPIMLDKEPQVNDRIFYSSGC